MYMRGLAVPWTKAITVGGSRISRMWGRPWTVVGAGCIACGRSGRMLFVVGVACLSQLMASSSSAGWFLDPFPFLTLTFNAPLSVICHTYGIWHVQCQGQGTNSVRNQPTQEIAIMSRNNPLRSRARKTAHTHTRPKSDRQDYLARTANCTYNRPASEYLSKATTAASFGTHGHWLERPATVCEGV
jgi:hypothetical protein